MTDAATRSAAAKRLLDDPMLQEVFGNVRDAAIEAWVRTASADVQQRETAWLTVKVVDRVKAELEAVVTNGKIAAARVQAPIR